MYKFRMGSACRLSALAIVIILNNFHPDTAQCQSVVKVMARQPLKLEVNLDNEIIATRNSSVVISDRLIILGGTPPFSYIWKQGEQSVSTGQYFEVQSGTMTRYSVIITDANGCTSTNPVSVGITDYDIDPVRIYPVPARTFITIDPGSNAGKTKITLFKLTGDILWEGEINDKYILSLNYPSGIYYLEIKSGIKTTVKKLLIVD